MSTLVYNPFSFDLHYDPYETFRRLRDEEPAYWNDELKFWVLSRFDDVQDAFRDFETFSSRGGVAVEARRRIGDVPAEMEQMIEMDPPNHTSFRKLVNRVFTVRRVADMEDEVRLIVDKWIDRFIEAGEADLIDQLTSPFPMDVICAALGIPEEDRDGLRAHSDKLLIREDGKMQIPKEAGDAMFAMLDYFIKDLPRRKDGEGEGLINDLVGLEVEGRKLTDAELMGFCILFIVAGHETTTKMVANVMDQLTLHPEQHAQVVADPSLVPGVVEETMRFHNSTQYMHRTLTRDIERHGETMREGDSVLLQINAANHDPREFGETAHLFDIHRRPDRHLAFGYGAHFCLGAALARMEGRVALEQIHARLPDIQVDHDNKVRYHSSNVSGYRHLPVTFTPGERIQ